MPITRLNHAVLYVRDAERTARFYEENLGFTRLTREQRRSNAVFLKAPNSDNDHDLGVFGIGDRVGPSMAGRATVGLYHLGWEVDTLDELERIGAQLAASGALVGASDHGTSKSLYAKDPDGIEFEVAWVIPEHLVDDEAIRKAAGIGPLDIAAEKQHYGHSTLGRSGSALV